MRVFFIISKVAVSCVLLARLCTHLVCRTCWREGTSATFLWLQQPTRTDRWRDYHLHGSVMDGKVLNWIARPLEGRRQRSIWKGQKASKAERHKSYRRNQPSSIFACPSLLGQLIYSINQKDPVIQAPWVVGRKQDKYISQHIHAKTQLQFRQPRNVTLN